MLSVSWLQGRDPHKSHLRRFLIWRENQLVRNILHHTKDQLYSCSSWNQLTLSRKSSLIFTHQPESKSESLKRGGRQPKHSRNQQRQEAPSSVFSRSPGKAAEQACHIKYHRETRRFGSNINKVGKWKQNAAKQGEKETQRMFKACVFSVMEQTTLLTAGKRDGSNASGFLYSPHHSLHYQELEIRLSSERLVLKVFWCSFILQRSTCCQVRRLAEPWTESNRIKQ